MWAGGQGARGGTGGGVWGGPLAVAGPEVEPRLGFKGNVF